METVLSMLASVRQGDWKVSIDLKDAPGRLVVQAPSLEGLSSGEGHGTTYLYSFLSFGIPTNRGESRLGRLRASTTLKRRVKVPSLVENSPCILQDLEDLQAYAPPLRLAEVFSQQGKRPGIWI